MTLQRELHYDEPAWEVLDVPGADVRLMRGAVEFEAGDALMSNVVEQTPWRSDTAVIMGKSYPVPRLQHWVGPKSYAYSGMTIDPGVWTTALWKLRSTVEDLISIQFNSVFLNLYRDGQDSIGWHADDVNEEDNSPIVSLSFGATRDFVLRRISDHRRVPIELRHGDVLVMAGSTQRLWQHSVPARATVVEPRLSLTFRNVRTG